MNTGQNWDRFEYRVGKKQPGASSAHLCSPIEDGFIQLSKSKLGIRLGEATGSFVSKLTRKLDEFGLPDERTFPKPPIVAS